MFIRDWEDFKKKGRKKIRKVGEMKEYYKNVSGHENEINYEVYWLDPDYTRTLKIFVGMTVLHPGRVNEEHKMTRGHSHETEEIYIFVKGKGKMILKKGDEKYEFDVKEGSIVTIPSCYWHRVINTGDEPLVFYTIKESSKEFLEYIRREFK